jgi:beta-glucanase (GH16 family)
MRKSAGKKFKLMLMLLVSVSIASWSCSDGSSSNDTVVITPTNLVVTSEIVGQTVNQPTGDGSGVLHLTISANNATSFKISYGDGTTQNAVSGKNTYTYKTTGTFTYTIIVTAFNGTASTSSTLAVRIAAGTSPIWSDEFITNGAPDSSKWNYDIGTGSGGWGNNESQNYTNRADNVKVENGVLKIITKKESYQGSNYTSARLKTQAKFSVQYGRIEFRAKLPAGGGTWPALWMLGDNISTLGWPACGEIDIMEHKGNELNKIHGTLHFPGRSGGNPDTTTVTPNTTATTEFHNYAIEWRADAIKFYIDNNNVPFKTFTNNSNLPFNQKFFLIMNCAMGGTFGGTIDPNFVSSTFEIDYVRVFN